MIRVFLIRGLCLAFLLTSLPAFAQDIYPALSGKVPPLSGIGTEKRPTAQSIANDYYRQCDLAIEHPFLSITTKPLFCACVASFISEAFRYEEVGELLQATENGEKQRERVLRSAYFPCMAKPLHTMIYEQCTSDFKVKNRLRSPGRVCACLANGFQAHWLELEADGPMGRGYNWKVMGDPALLILRERVFEGLHDHYFPACLRKHQPKAPAG